MGHQEAIKGYWNERAKKNNTPSSTTNDIYIRELEINTLTREIKNLNLHANAKILDLGCGDGYTIINIARNLPSYNYTGYDYSARMIENAKKNLDKNNECTKNIFFNIVDAVRLRELILDETFDLIYTVRCLINLESSELQYDVLRQIYEILKPGGYYIAIENFLDTHDNLNNAREHMGLHPIRIRWHNLFFRESEFLHECNKMFRDIKFLDFASSYYFATRVIYSKLCHMEGQNPDYSHNIHKLAVNLPFTGKFSPIRMAILCK